MRLKLEDLPFALQDQVSAQLHGPRKANRIVPNPVAQCDQTPALGCTIQGEAQSMGRVTVKFTGYRVKPLDPDNFAGSVKDLLDGLRKCELIKGDEPWRIILQTEQVKVPHFEEERTEIELIYP